MIKSKIELPLCLKRPKSCMSPEEKQIQRALGLLNDWIVSVLDREELHRLGTYRYYRCTGREPRIIIVVEAVSREHALEQVRQANILPKGDLVYPRPYTYAYESNKYGAYCRAYCREHCHDEWRCGERIYVL